MIYDRHFILYIVFEQPKASKQKTSKTVSNFDFRLNQKKREKSGWQNSKSIISLKYISDSFKKIKQPNIVKTEKRKRRKYLFYYS